MDNQKLQLGIMDKVGLVSFENIGNHSYWDSKYVIFYLISHHLKWNSSRLLFLCETIAFVKGKATSMFEMLVTDLTVTNITEHCRQHCSQKGLVFVNLFVWMLFCLLPLIVQRIRHAGNFLKNFLENMRREGIFVGCFVI